MIELKHIQREFKRAFEAERNRLSPDAVHAGNILGLELGMFAMNSNNPSVRRLTYQALELFEAARKAN